MHLHILYYINTLIIVCKLLKIVSNHLQSILVKRVVPVLQCLGVQAQPGSGIRIGEVPCQAWVDHRATNLDVWQPWAA